MDSSYVGSYRTTTRPRDWHSGTIERRSRSRSRPISIISGRQRSPPQLHMLIDNSPIQRLHRRTTLPDRSVYHLCHPSCHHRGEAAALREVRAAAAELQLDRRGFECWNHRTHETRCCTRSWHSLTGMIVKETTVVLHNRCRPRNHHHRHPMMMPNEAFELDPSHWRITQNHRHWRPSPSYHADMLLHHA